MESGPRSTLDVITSALQAMISASKAVLYFQTVSRGLKVDVQRLSLA